MSRMNGPTRKKLYTIIAERNGEYCRGCSALASERQLVLDHKDNNNDNNDPNNFQFLCRSCNYIKNPRRPVDMCVSESEDHVESEIERSDKKQPIFRKFVYHQLNERNYVPRKILRNAGAEYAEISTVTADRYLDKICSEIGLCEEFQVGKTIVIRYKREKILI